MATAGACTAAAEKKKRTRYEALCKHRGMTLVPFVVESYGGVGPAARAFLHKLASAGCEVTAESFLLDALIRLSVALQRGNALVLQRGMQQLRVEQSALAGPDAALGGPLHRASRRRQQRLFGERSAAVQRLDLGDLFHASMRAGGGRTTARRFCDTHVTIEGSAA
jgi:hypothetical protein